MKHRRSHRSIILPSLAWLSVGAACGSNPVCEEAVVTRLLDECKISFSGVSSAACASLPGAPADTGPALARSLSRRSCERADPESFDADCLRTTSCMEIELGACTMAASETDPGCAAQCGDEAFVCGESCGDGTDYAGCTGCLDRCADAEVDCRLACE